MNNTIQAEIQEGSSFPADNHQTIRNKTNKKSRGKEKDSENKPPQKHHIGTVSNKLLAGEGDFNWFYARVTHDLLLLWFINIMLIGPRGGLLLINASPKKKYKSRINTEMKKER